MPTLEFTDRWLRYLKVAERTDFFDKKLPTFGVRASPTGRRSWFVLYTLRGERKKRRLMLGEYPGVGLSEARTAAHDAIGLISKGGDPKLEAAAGISFGELAGLYMTRHSEPRKRTAILDRAALNNDLLPHWRDVPAASIRRRQVVALLDGIVARGAPIQANRVRSVISAIFTFGIQRDLVEFNPVANTAPPAPENRRERTLSDEEIRVFWRETASLYGPVRDALRGILLTAQRPGEVAGLVRSELAGDAWTIPSARYKSKREHVVPVVGLFAEIVTAGGSPSVFASDVHHRRGLPITRGALSMSLLKIRRRIGWPDTRPHDLRRTAARNMARLGVSRFVVSRVLGHSDSSVTGRYDTWEYFAEKKAALLLWDAHVRSVVSSG